MTAAEPNLWSALAARWLAGRKLVLVGGPVAALTPLAAQLRALGAEPPFVLGSGVGSGALPDPDTASWHALDPAGADLIDAIRAAERALLDLPLAARAALERYDPESRALVLGGVFLDGVREIGGRRRWAPHPARSAALEEKARIDTPWDAVGVARAPSVTMPAAGALLRAAARRLDRGAGTVWSGDARDGENGGASYVRWVRDASDAAGAEMFFADGFRPTELNPRFSAGLNLLADSARDVPLWWLGQAALAGEAAPWMPRPSRRTCWRPRTSGAPAAPGSRSRSRSTRASRTVVDEGDRYRLAIENERGDGALVLGPGDLGGFVRFAPRSRSVAPGPTFAPRAVRALDLAARSFGLSIGSLEPACHVR